MADTPGAPARMASESAFASRPTRWTLFLRTCVPWQLVRFAVINLRMISLVRRSHRGMRR
jgi:hypothetical protein